MKAIIALLGLLFCALSPQGAEARVQHPPAFTFCPFGAAIPDGCGQAPLTGSFQLANCWTNGGYVNQLAGTPTNYVGQITYNDPGCAYPIGVDIPISQLTDPAVTQPTGCTYNPTGSLDGSNPTLVCNTGFLGTISGYNFGPVGGHGCTNVFMESTSFGGLTDVYVEHSLFQNDGHCASVNVPAALFSEHSNSTYLLHLISDTFDGQGLTYSDVYGACGPSSLLACNATSAFGSINDVVFQYTVVENFAARPVQGGFGAGQGMVINGSSFVGWDLRNPQFHGEIFIFDVLANASQMNVTYSDFIGATGTDFEHLADIPTSFSGGFSYVNPESIVVDHDIHILPMLGGTQAQSATVNASIAAGTSQVTITSISPSGAYVGSGQELICGSNGLGGALYTPYSGQASAGPGGGWKSNTVPQTWGIDTIFTNNLPVPATGSFSGTTLNITGAGLFYPAASARVTATGSTLTGGVSNGSGAAGTSLVVSADTTITLGSSTGAGGVGSTITGSNAKTITATVSSSSNQLVVTAASGITLVVGTAVSGTNIPSGTTISSLSPSGTGTTGTYTLSANSTGAVSNPTATNAIPSGTTISSGGPGTTGTYTLSASAFVDPGTTLTATNPLVGSTEIITPSGTATGNQSIGNLITATVAAGSNQLVVTAVPAGVTLTVGAALLPANLPPGTTISSLSPSGTGTTGTYTLSANAIGPVINPTVGSSQTVGSQLLTISVPNSYDGGWQVTTTQTCTSVNVGQSNPQPAFLDVSVQGNGEYVQVFATNNLFDTSPGGSSNIGSLNIGGTPGFTSVCSNRSIVSGNVDMWNPTNPNANAFTGLTGTGCW